MSTNTENAEVKQDKTPAQVKAEKFAANPEAFIDTDNLICGTMRTDKGIGTFIGECTRDELEKSQSRINYKINEAFRFLDMQKIMDKKESEIIVQPYAAGNGNHRKPFAKG